MSRISSLLASLAVATASLGACVVLPLDPATGQPYRAYQPPQQVTVLQSAPAAPQTVVMTARLYPVNEQANRAGMLTAIVTDHQGGRGSFSVGYAGDTLQGEATRVDGSHAAFGRIHAEVLGPTTRAFQGRRGIANGYGPRGTNTQCEYLLTAPGIGTGACLFSDGAKYQMHFGN